ncbi:MAG: CocE/NonD family hydrolase [Anaerolineae bacterium]
MSGPILHNVIVPMRDRTRLRADVYLPRGDGPFPALVERTPYGKEASIEVQIDAPRFFTDHGYAVVIQDVRGRFQSQGRFYPFKYDGWGEQQDGYDTVEWIAAQPWCDGRVGTIGGSYAGATQYRMAPTRPPHLRAMAARQSASDYWAEWVYHGGAFELGFMLHWTLRWELFNLAHLMGKDDDEFERRRAALADAIEDMDDLYLRLPLAPDPLVLGLEDWYNEFLAHPADGPFWWQWSIARKHREIDTPIFHIGGWFDIFITGTLKNFTGLRASAHSQAARNAQRLLVGPWIHSPANMLKPTQGEVDFGPASMRDYNEMRLPWFDHWLKGIPNGVMDEPPVQLFVMGENSWLNADTYPLPETRYQGWYFRARGELTQSPPSGNETPDSFVYDPADPTPTLGGCTLYIPSGPLDQTPAEAWGLTYTSAPLERDLTIVGPVSCGLLGASSAVDTDWVVRLTDVDEAGFSRLLCDGILRARYRASHTQPAPLTPDEVYEFVVDLWATANTFKAGHHIRVAVCSSSFPRFDRNLGTSGVPAEGGTVCVQRNTVFHDALRPSRIVLPVIPR